MELSDKIKAIYPDLTDADFFPGSGTIVLKKDYDHPETYIAEWRHPVHPQPTQEQLDAIGAQND